MFLGPTTLVWGLLFSTTAHPVAKQQVLSNDFSGRPTCEECVPSENIYASALGIDLTTTYGTAAIKSHDGTIIDVGRFDGDEEYRNMMQRLAAPYNRLEPPFDNIRDQLRYTRQQIVRRLRLLRGLPSTKDIETLSKFLSYIYTTAYFMPPARLPPKVLTAFPRLPNLSIADVDEALAYHGLINLKSHKYYGLLGEVNAAYAGMGFGLCSHYRDLEKCDSEESKMFKQTLTISLTEGELSIHLSNAWNAHSMYDLVDRRYPYLGFVEGEGEKRRDPGFWREMGDRIKEIASQSTVEMEKRELLIIGESGEDEDFLKTVKKALEELGMQDLYTRAQVPKFSAEFVAARGAAALALRWQGEPWNCVEPEYCGEPKRPVCGENERLVNYLKKDEDDDSNFEGEWTEECWYIPPRKRPICGENEKLVMLWKKAAGDDSDFEGWQEEECVFIPPPSTDLIELEKEALRIDAGDSTSSTRQEPVPDITSDTVDCMRDKICEVRKTSIYCDEETEEVVINTSNDAETGLERESWWECEPSFRMYEVPSENSGKPEEFPIEKGFVMESGGMEDTPVLNIEGESEDSKADKMYESETDPVCDMETEQIVIKEAFDLESNSKVIAWVECAPGRFGIPPPSTDTKKFERIPWENDDWMLKKTKGLKDIPTFDIKAELLRCARDETCQLTKGPTCDEGTVEMWIRTVYRPRKIGEGTMTWESKCAPSPLWIIVPNPNPGQPEPDLEAGDDEDWEGNTGLILTGATCKIEKDRLVIYKDYVPNVNNIPCEEGSQLVIWLAKDSDDLSYFEGAKRRIDCRDFIRSWEFEEPFSMSVPGSDANVASEYGDLALEDYLKNLFELERANREWAKAKRRQQRFNPKYPLPLSEKAKTNPIASDDSKTHPLYTDTEWNMRGETIKETPFVIEFEKQVLAGGNLNWAEFEILKEDIQQILEVEGLSMEMIREWIGEWLCSDRRTRSSKDRISDFYKGKIRIEEVGVEDATEVVKCDADGEGLKEENLLLEDYQKMLGDLQKVSRERDMSMEIVKEWVEVWGCSHRKRIADDEKAEECT